jgi:hypothetical protein
MQRWPAKYLPVSSRLCSPYPWLARCTRQGLTHVHILGGGLAAARSAKIQLSADVVDGLVLLYAGRSLTAGKAMYEHCIDIGQMPSLSLAQMERKAAKQNTAKPRASDLDGTLVPVLPV